MRRLDNGEREHSQATRVNHTLKVEIQNADGLYIDRTAYVVRANWGAHRDQEVKQGSMSLRRQDGAGNSLAPLMTGSALNVDGAMAYAPAVDIGRFLRISTLTAPPGVVPIPWLFRFDVGDSVTAKGGTFTRADLANDIATYFDRDGYVRYAAANTLRDNHWINGKRYFIIEGVATNSRSWSRDYTATSGATWTRANVTVTKNQTGADGKVNGACLLTEAVTVAGVHCISATSPAVAAATEQYFYGIFKANGRTRAALYLSSDATAFGADRAGVIFNLTTGTASIYTLGAGNVTKSGMIPLADGRYFVWVVATVGGASTTNTLVVRLADATGQISYNGDGVSGMVVDFLGHELNKSAPSMPIANETGTTRSRAMDLLQFPFLAAPQALQMYSDGIDIGASMWGTANYSVTTNALIGRGAGLTRNFHNRLDAPTKRAQIVHNESGGTQVVSTVAGNAVSYGARLEMLGTLHSDGAVEAASRLNDGAILTTAKSAAFALPVSWGSATIELGSGFGSNGGWAMSSVRVVAGTGRTMDEIATAPEYREVFLGIIDDIAWEQDPIQLTFSDEGVLLVDTQVETGGVDYGSTDASVSVETVIQQILTAWPSGVGAVPTLYTPESPSWYPVTKTLDRVKVLEAILAYAHDIGWDLRYRYDSAHVARLTLSDPDRTRTTIDTTIGPNEYSDVTRLGYRKADIKNAGRVPYVDSVLGLQYAADSDAASIAKYGRRFFELPETGTINTAVEANALIDRVVNDLSGAPAEQVIRCLYLWFVDVHDRYTFLANGVHYDQDQTFAVVSYNHVFENGEGWTDIETSGRIIGAYTAWQRRLTTTSASESDGPSLEVVATPGVTDFDVIWSGSGTIQYSLDGAAFVTPPASPFTVLRDATTDKTITFTATKNEQTITNSVTIPSLEKNTVAPDLTVVAATPAATTQNYTVTADDPSVHNDGGALTITAKVTGTSMVIGGVTHADGSTVAIASGTVVTANRPSSTTTTQAHIIFTASLALGGAEQIQRTVPAQLNIGPLLEVTATPGATAGANYSIAWAATGTTTLSIDGAAYASPPASPISVARHATLDKTYNFKCIRDGQTITNSVTIPSLEKDTVTPDLQLAVNTPTATVSSFGVFAEDPRTPGVSLGIYIRSEGTTFDVPVAPGPYAAGVWHGPFTPGSLMEVQVARPSSTTTTQAHIMFRTTIAGGGTELITRTIPPQLNIGPLLDVQAQPSGTNYIITYTATGTLTYAGNGGAYVTPPASPITIARHATNDQTYSFKCIRDGQTITNTVTLPSLEKDTVMPNLNVTPGTVNATYQEYTVTGSNPSGGAMPTLTVEPTNVTYTVNGGAVQAGPLTLASGDVVRALRPTSTQSTESKLRFYAALAGGGTEEIIVQVLPELNVGPTLELVANPGTGTSNYTLTYTATGTVTYDQDGFGFVTPPASPISVPRGATADKVYTFKVVKDGQTVVNSVTVPSLEKDTVTPDLVLTNYNPTDPTRSNWIVTASNPSGGAAPTITVTPIECQFEIRTGAAVYISGPHTTPQSLSSGQMLVIDRPATTQATQASILVKATIAGGGEEQISRTIPAQLNLGPTLTLEVTPGETSYSIAYVATGTLTYAGNGGGFVTPPASPITWARDATDQTVVFKCSKDGQTITDAVAVPKLVPYNPSLAITVSGDDPTNNVTVSLTVSGMLSGTTYDIDWDFDNGATKGSGDNQSFPKVISVPTLDASTPYRVTVTAMYAGSVVATKTKAGMAVPI